MQIKLLIFNAVGRGWVWVWGLMGSGGGVGVVGGGGWGCQYIIAMFWSGRRGQNIVEV